jgi:hypothetical protein
MGRVLRRAGNCDQPGQKLAKAAPVEKGPGAGDGAISCAHAIRPPKTQDVLPIDKSFLLLFFKKEGLAFCVS